MLHPYPLIISLWCECVYGEPCGVSVCKCVSDVVYAAESVCALCSHRCVGACMYFCVWMCLC